MNLTPVIQRNQAMLRSKLAMKPIKGGNKPENTLVVIRHGSTALNNESDERFRGWADVPLAQEGVKEITDSLPALKKAKLDGLITSDLSRTVATAQIISKELNIPILEKTPNLRPWNLGYLTGQPVKPNLPILQDYIKNKPDTPVPQGESFNSFKQRTLREIQSIQQRYPNDKIGIVTHHRNERLIQGWMDEGKPDNALKVSPKPFMNKGIPPGSFTDHEIPPPKA